jgi:outer membrane protein
MKIWKLLLLASPLLVLAESPALASEPGTWTLRAGVGVVEPKSNNLVFSDGVDTLQIDVDSGTSMTLSATYMFSRNWAFDILASWPFSHDINATAVGAGPGIDGVPVKIAETTHLPPTFSVQYHFLPDGTFQPYAGIGLNWTTFFDTNVVSELVAEGVEDLELDDSFGFAGQLGADWMLNEKWLLNVDVRWINIEADATLSGTAFGGSVDIGTVKVDPWVYALNIGYRF